MKVCEILGESKAQMILSTYANVQRAEYFTTYRRSIAAEAYLKLLKKLWADPVWSKVIATAIVAAIAAMLAYFQNWWRPTILDYLIAAGQWTIASTSVPNWLLVPLVICSLAVVGVTSIATWLTLIPRPNKQSFASYTDDNFFGIHWRWRYGANGKILSLHPLCPHCDFQILPRVHGFIDEVEYRCDDCGAQINRINMSLENLEGHIERKIQKELRARFPVHN